MKTDYAPPERASVETIQEQYQKVLKDPTLQKILNAIPEAVMILNSQRQIVFCNDATLQTLGIQDVQAIFGQRPGEALQCIHAVQSESGCGTTEFCRYCGAVNSILQCQAGNVSVAECCITPNGQEQTFELKVKSSPFQIDDEIFTIFSIVDISNEKRREFLERIFFHDILNTAGGLQGYSELLQDAEGEELGEFKKAIFSLSEQLVDEIKAQRQLIAAENDDLTVNLMTWNSREIVEQVVRFYRLHPVALEKEIAIAECADLAFVTDEVLFSRVLGNLLKNALEASDRGQTVTIGCQATTDFIVFQVHNDKPMPRNVQMQLFQKSFSTKGKGRGLGTYSIKLLSEKYLKGAVDFQSTAEQGTTFTVKFPIHPDE